MVTGRFDSKSFHIQVVFIYSSFEVYQQQQQLQFIQLSNNLSLCMYRQVVSHTWLKEWKPQNVFLVQMQTFYEVIKLFAKFHCLSSYQNDFESKWLVSIPPYISLACENIPFSSLFAAGDVSRGGTSVTQRQKFHTDDVKSVRNPVRSADWSTE